MNVFVGNLAESVTPEDLRKAFAGYGTVVNTIIMKDTITGQPLGRGHVYLVPEEAAREAIAALHDVPLKGQSVAVRECVYRAKQDRRASRPLWNDAERRCGSDRRRNGVHAEAHALKLASRQGAPRQSL